VNLQPFIPPTPIIYDDFPSLQLFPVPFFAPARHAEGHLSDPKVMKPHSRKNAPEAPTPPPLIISYRFFLHIPGAPSEKSRACYCAACREGFILIPSSLSSALQRLMYYNASSARLSRDAPWEFSSLDARLFIVSNDNKLRPMLILAV